MNWEVPGLLWFRKLGLARTATHEDRVSNQGTDFRRLAVGIFGCAAQLGHYDLGKMEIDFLYPIHHACCSPKKAAAFAAASGVDLGSG